MKQKSLVLIGGGGHCRSCIDVIESEGNFRIEGILDLEENIGKEVLGYRITGTDGNLAGLISEDTYFLVTIGHTGNVRRRMEIYNELISRSANLPTIVSPLSRISTYSKIENGNIVMHYAFINAGASLGSNCIINSYALIEHDVQIGSHCHISTGSRINGDCRIGDACFIGSGAILYNNIKLCSNVIIAAGSVVTKSFSNPGLYAGSPARKIK